MPSPTEVFTPNDYYKHTYVARDVSPPLEDQLRSALAIPKMVVSISGPSKSGKSVLIENIVGSDNLIIISGSEIHSPDDLWDLVLNWMGTPETVTVGESSTLAAQTSTAQTGARGVHPWPKPPSSSERKTQRPTGLAKRLHRGVEA